MKMLSQGVKYLQTIFRTVLTLPLPPFEKTWHENVAASDPCVLKICNLPSRRTEYLLSYNLPLFFLHSRVMFTVGSCDTSHGNQSVIARCAIVVAFGPFVIIVGSEMEVNYIYLYI